ncbi:uncharacterized protein LOC109833261 isoform X2 [Asparagus officinalis]|nr:uncharacterized protein LOC109833261 isoform X2 [Asparagus officinalis]
MNILGLVFPASLFQEADHPSPLEKNDSRTKSPGAVVSKPMRKKIKEASEGIKCQENPPDQERSRKSSAYLSDCSRELADVSNTRPLPLSRDEPAKRTSKKKKKKKGKSNKVLLDDNIASETVTSKISLSRELVGCDHSKAAVRYQTAKEVIGKSIHDKIYAKQGSISSESTLYESKHFLNTADTEGFPNISKLSSEIAAFQDPASGKKNIDGTCNSKSGRNEENNIEQCECSSIITSVTTSNPMSVFLEDTRGSYVKALAVSSSIDSSNPIGAHIEPWNENCRVTETCEKGQHGSSYATERSDTHIQGTFDTNYCITIANTKESCSRSVAADSRTCYKNLHLSLGKGETDRYGGWKEVSNKHPKFCDHFAVVAVQNSWGVKGDDGKDSKMEVTSGNQYSGVKWTSQVSNSTSRISFPMNYRNKTGKENVNFTWKRTGRYIGSSSTDGRNISDQNHLFMDSAQSGTTSVSKNNSSKVEISLLPPCIPYDSKDAFQQKVQYSGGSLQKMYKTKCSMPIKASEWPTRGSFHARHGQYTLRQRDDVMGNSSLECSKTKLDLPSEQEYVNRGGGKESGAGNPNQCKPRTSKTFYHEIITTDVAETTSTEGLKPELCCDSSIEEDKSSMRSGTEPHYDADEFTSRASLPKWIPVSKKESLMLKMGGSVDHNNVQHKQDLDTSGGASCVSDITRDVNMSNGLSNVVKQRSLRKDTNSNFSASGYKLKNFPIHICSYIAKYALKASFATQISSENFQLATGTPIAEFERLLSSASPVIPSSSFLQHSNDAIKHEPVSDSFIKLLKPSIALRDVWQWYEKPGNYGLQVKAEDTKGLQVNVLFHAHFVPFLSAVQLFSRPYHSVGSCSESTSGSMPERRDTDESLCPSSASSSLCLPDDSHVIFEYFEHEPPQQRRTLSAKIKELLEVGTSKPQAFGDPSKLECLNVQDLHPASWYSVAWYPIYRIPEGGFRASFLTYHSLGHFRLKGTGSDSIKENAFCVVCPVLGMQSYNAQGECWFYLKKPAENLLKGYKPADISQLLKERLRTLKETAALFSRGHVQRDGTTAINRHPDYEFFLSRKQ